MEMLANYYKIDVSGDRESISNCLLCAQAFCIFHFSKFDRLRSKSPERFCSLSLVTQMPDLPEDQATFLVYVTLLSKA